MSKHLESLEFKTVTVRFLEKKKKVTLGMLGRV